MKQNSSSSKLKLAAIIGIAAAVIMAILLVLNITRKDPVSVFFEDPIFSVHSGESVDIRAITYNMPAGSQLFFISSDSSIAKVDGITVTGMNQGSATITALINGKEYSQCTVNVESAIQPVSIAIDPDLDGKLGRNNQIKIIFAPENVTDTEVAFSVSDASLAKLDGDKITYLSCGTLTITAHHLSSGLTAEHTIDITPVELNSMSIVAPSTMVPGKTLQLKVKFLPGDTTEQEVTWKSSNNAVASIENGVLTAKKEGIVTITATHTATGITASHKLVISEIYINSLRITSSSNVSLGGTINLTASYTPANATKTDLRWSTSNASIASISNGVLTAKKVGTVTITVKDACTGQTATKNITVNPVNASSIALSPSTKTAYPGDTFTLSATISPANTTDKTITWRTSNSSIATVKNGKVTIHKTGTVTITAVTANGKTATCTITVKPKALTITNGFVIKPAGTRCAPVKINAPYNESVYVYFKCTTNSKNSFSMLVKAGTSCEVSAPLGDYTMYYASGTTWYGTDLKFGDNTEYFKSSEIISLTSTRTATGYSYRGIELTLNKVVGGNFYTSEISASQFPG